MNYRLDNNGHLRDRYGNRIKSAKHGDIKIEVLPGNHNLNEPDYSAQSPKTVADIGCFSLIALALVGFITSLSKTSCDRPVVTRPISQPPEPSGQRGFVDELITDSKKALREDGTKVDRLLHEGRYIPYPECQTLHPSQQAKLHCNFVKLFAPRNVKSKSTPRNNEQNTKSLHKKPDRLEQSTK